VFGVLADLGKGEVRARPGNRERASVSAVDSADQYAVTRPMRSKTHGRR